MPASVELPPTPELEARPRATASRKKQVVRGPFPYRKLFWKWHLYAGLVGAPLMVLIAITGAVLVFSPEIDRALRPDLWHVPLPASGTASSDLILDQPLIDAVRTRFPESKIISYRQNSHADEPYHMVTLTPGLRGIHDVWVNPYTAEIVGDRRRETSFVRIMEQLHRRLLTGEIGSSIVEFITGWAIVLALTGTYLWWPKTLKQLWQGLTLPVRGGAYKINWRLHNTIGAWSAAVLLVLSATGMVFSTYSGGMYNRISAATGSRKSPLFAPPPSKPAEGKLPESIDTVLEKVRADAAPGQRFNVQMPRQKDGSIVVTTLRPERPTWTECQDQRGWCCDQYSGEILTTIGWDQLHPMTRFRLLSLVLHFGSVFGLPTKIAALLACLAIPILAITGCLIWWWKRAAKIAAVRRNGHRPEAAALPLEPISLWVVAGLGILCLLFPTIGVSFALVAAYEATRARFRSAETAASAH